MDKFILDKNFWMILKEVEDSDKSMKFEYLIEKYNITENEIFEMVSYLDSFDYKMLVANKDGEKYLSRPEIKKIINFSFTFIEWMAMQAHFPKMSEDESKPYHKILSNKLGEVEAQFPELDIYSNRYQNCFEFIGLIKSAMIDKSLLYFKLTENRNLEVLPHQLVYIDGKLSLVGEEKNDRCLVYFDVDSIKQINDGKTEQYKQNFGMSEVNDFVMALRSVEGKEVRLIMKVTSKAGNIDLKPEYHLLGSPYVTCNMEGDFIWAATVEVSGELFEWLYSIHKYIEILDPENIKAEFDEYLKQAKTYSVAS